ncbi:trypsin-like serine peptidase [Falsiroseomonas sp. HW251]|uniref:trypsin-like serine peptidase n=1 Tax=Falsiroseomonas sp. HW251 TaxID=3390998 RepID=UPI003D324413
MTNHHVLGDPRVAAASMAEFDYARRRDGTLAASRTFTLAPEVFFHADPGLDYAVVAIRPVANDGRPLAEFGYNLLDEAEGKAIAAQWANIIQHPGGDPKQLSLRENRIANEGVRISRVIGHLRGQVTDIAERALFEAMLGSGLEAALLVGGASPTTAAAPSGAGAPPAAAAATLGPDGAGGDPRPRAGRPRGADGPGRPQARLRVPRRAHHARARARRHGTPAPQHRRAARGRHRPASGELRRPPHPGERAGPGRDAYGQAGRRRRDRGTRPRRRCAGRRDHLSPAQGRRAGARARDHARTRPCQPRCRLDAAPAVPRRDVALPHRRHVRLRRAAHRRHHRGAGGEARLPRPAPGDPARAERRHGNEGQRPDGQGCRGAARPGLRPAPRPCLGEDRRGERLGRVILPHQGGGAGRGHPGQGRLLAVQRQLAILQPARCRSAEGAAARLADQLQPRMARDRGASGPRRHLRQLSPQRFRQQPGRRRGRGTDPTRPAGPGGALRRGRARARARSASSSPSTRHANSTCSRCSRPTTTTPRSSS